MAYGRQEGQGVAVGTVRQPMRVSPSVLCSRYTGNFVLPIQQEGVQVQPCTNSQLHAFHFQARLRAYSFSSATPHLFILKRDHTYIHHPRATMHDHAHILSTTACIFAKHDCVHTHYSRATTHIFITQEHWHISLFKHTGNFIQAQRRIFTV